MQDHVGILIDNLWGLIHTLMAMTGSIEIINGRIWTADPSQPWAESVTIRDGRVEAINKPCGSESVVDAGGRTITPGLIDAHVHLLEAGQSLNQLDLGTVDSRESFETAIAARHAELAPDRWLIGRGWSNENWPGAENPDKAWLAAAGDRPTVCTRMDIHAVLVNDAVLRMCDLSAQPVGGRIVRDSDTGEPTGLMVEAAAWSLINPLIPQDDPGLKQQAVLDAQDKCLRFGVTAVRSMEYLRDLESVYLPMRDKLKVHCQVTVLDRDWPMSFDAGRNFPNDDNLAVLGYKAFVDGTLGSRTARMLREYDDDPGNRGIFVELAARGQLDDWARGVAAAGLAPAIHAIGDEGARVALDVIDLLDDDCRASLEHAQQLDALEIPRCGGRIVSMQPLHKADDARYVERRLGADRLSGTFAFRRLLETGAILAFGSDWPVVTCDPMEGIRAAVTGLTLDGEVFGADQNITVEQALHAYTRDAAYSIGLDDAGILRPGAFGDLVMFDRDPFEADWVDRPPTIMITVVGGERDEGH